MTDVDAVLARVLADLSPTSVQRRAVGRAAVEVDGRALVVHVATRGRLLLRITETTFVLPGPAWDVGERGPVSLQVGHRGSIRRTGIRVAVRRGGERARALAGELAGSSTFAAAMLPLDFTDFTVVDHDGCLVARIVLMGASMTRFRLPPTSSYTRLHDDQRAALLATAAAFEQHWSRR